MGRPKLTIICETYGCQSAALQAELQQVKEERDRLDKVIVKAMIPLAEALGACGMNPRKPDSLAKWVRRLRAERDAAIEKEASAINLGLQMLKGYCEALARASAAERGVRDLEAVLMEQWLSNHAEHCGFRGPHENCQWPMPEILQAQEERSE